MMFLELNFFRVIISYLLYYGNYIALYIFIYYLFVKGDRFKGFILFFWEKYHNEKKNQKNLLNEKNILVHDVSIQLHEQTNNYNLLKVQCEYIKNKKKTLLERYLHSTSNYKKSYYVYMLQCEEKIKEDRKKVIIENYLWEVIEKETQAYDDFTFVKKIELIGKGLKNEYSA